MQLTTAKIKNGLYEFIKGSHLEQEVTGVLCKRGKRPKNSKKEDIVISVITNEFGQRQVVSANVNIYTQDTFNDLTGQYEETTERVDIISEMAMELLEVGRICGARFTLESQNLVEVEKTNEHCINNRLKIVKINE